MARDLNHGPDEPFHPWKLALAIPALLGVGSVLVPVWLVLTFASCFVVLVHWLVGWARTNLLAYRCHAPTRGFSWRRLRALPLKAMVGMPRRCQRKWGCRRLFLSGLPVPMLDGPMANSRLNIPESAQPRRLARIDATGIAAIHLIALLAFVPWFFSWTGAVLAILGLYVFGTLGISLCFHRMLTHRGVVCPKWFERSLAILGLCCVQDTPARWVGMHRRHHEHADEQPDPHSPLAGFLWAHIGWMVFRNRDLTRLRLVSRYAKDIVRDPFYAWLEKDFRWVRVVLISWLSFFAGGFLVELVQKRSGLDAIQFGFSVLIWGVFVRTVLVWHITWSVNSVTHLWGYRNYETDESSRNNLIIGFLSNGEGWHNNHHAAPGSARFGWRWWELDATWLTIRLLSALGLARKIVQRPPSLAIAGSVDRHGV